MPGDGQVAKLLLRIRLGRFFRRCGEIHFDSEIAALAPAKVKVEPAALVGEEWQHGQLAPGHRKIPTAIRAGIPLRIFAAADEFPVRNADDVVIEIVERIAEMPQKNPVFGIRPKPGWRNRIIHVPEPPDRIELVVKMNFRQVGIWRDFDAVPADGIRADRRGLHLGRLPRRRNGPRKNGRADDEQQHSRSH